MPRLNTNGDPEPPDNDFAENDEPKCSFFHRHHRPMDDKCTLSNYTKGECPYLKNNLDCVYYQMKAQQFQQIIVEVEEEYGIELIKEKEMI